MKKVMLVLLASLSAFFSQAQSEGFYYGTRLGLGESNIEGGMISNPTGKLMWQAGGSTVYQFSNNIGLGADFLLTGKGTKGNGEVEEGSLTGSTTYSYNDKISLLTGDVPIYVKASVGFGNIYLKVFGGPSINFNFGGLYSREFDDANYNEGNGFNNVEMKSLETIETSLMYGLGIDVKSGDGRLFFLDFRLANSLNSLGMLNGSEMNLNYLCLNAGYLFH